MTRSTALGLAHALAAAGTLDEVHDAIQHGLPSVLDATLATLGIVDLDGGELRVRPPGKVSPELQVWYQSVPLDSPMPIAEVARTGQELMLADHDAWRAHAPAAVVQDVIAGGLVTTVFVPLSDSTGAVVAALGVSWDREIEVDSPALATLRTIAELCVHALERAWTTDLAAQRAMDLARLAEQLADALTVEQALEVVASLGQAPVGAVATSIGLIDLDAGLLRTHHGQSVDDDVSRRFADPPLDARLALTDAARTGQAVLLEDYDAYVVRYPGSAASTASLGRGARAAVPIRTSTGEVVGSMVHAWAAPRVFDAALTSTITTIAEMAGQAIERAQLSDTEHRLVNALRASVVIPLPPMDGLVIASRYLPSARSIGMGGDWYHGVALDDHRYALIVGDVAGHGITAVGEMAQLQAVIGALVRLGTAPGEVFRQATALLRGGETAVTATALLVVVDTESATISYVAAGHPPPLLRTPQGATVILTDGRQPLLGVPMEAAPEVGMHAFSPGSILVTYTDGLVERRPEPIDRSIDRLRGHLQATTASDADSVADILIAASLAGREPDDDVAMVVVCREG